MVKSMTSRKTFQITDLNNEDIKALLQVADDKGIKVQQGSIINLAIELFFRHKEKDYSDIIQKMKAEHLF